MNWVQLERWLNRTGNVTLGVLMILMIVQPQSVLTFKVAVFLVGLMPFSIAAFILAQKQLEREHRNEENK